MPQFTILLSDRKGLLWQNRTKSTISVANEIYHSTKTAAGAGCSLIFFRVLLLFWDLLSDTAWYKSGQKIRDQQMILWLGHSGWEKAVSAAITVIPQGIWQLRDACYSILLQIQSCQLKIPLNSSWNLSSFEPAMNGCLIAFSVEPKAVICDDGLFAHLCFAG